MDVTALLGGADHPADILSVFDDSVTFREVLEGDFVPDRDVGLRSETAIRVVCRDDTEHVRPRFQIFDHDHTDIVLMIMD